MRRKRGRRCCGGHRLTRPEDLHGGRQRPRGQHRVEERELHGRGHEGAEHRRDHAHARSGLRVGQEVAADYSCSDDGSGVASCVGSVANGSPLDTGSPGDKTFTVNATDKAGNQASKSVSYSVADGTAPSIAFTNPTEGAVYKLGKKVVAGYSCADESERLGRGDLRGTLPVGARLDTSRMGAKTFTVRTSDNAGNSASQTVSYSVVYDFDGFLWPLVNPPQVNRWKAGRPVPVRFSLGSFRALPPWPPATRRSRPCPAAGAARRPAPRRRRALGRSARGPSGGVPSTAPGRTCSSGRPRRTGRVAAASSF